MQRAREIPATNEKGVALLAVLWLTVALSFMAMATAQLVRTEVAAVGNQMDGQREYYLARGGIEAAIYSISRYNPAPAAPSEGVPPSQFTPGKRWLTFQFPGGPATVEIVPEDAKLNANQATAEQLSILFAGWGVPPEESVALAAAIVEWRSPRTFPAGTAMDSYYAALPQPYSPRHAPVEQLEELLPVRGMSRDLFFGKTERTPEGKWRKWPALEDLLTAQPFVASVNPNYASYEVLRALPGWSDSLAADVIAARQAAPFRNLQELQSAVPGLGPVAGLTSLSFTEGNVFTLTATGTLPENSVRRSVRALVMIDGRLPLAHQILAWWNDWPTPQDLPSSGGSAGPSGSRHPS